MDEINCIPLSIPNLSGNEIEYVTTALREQWVSTAGASIREFEEKMAAYVHTVDACACQSGTAGLHLCLRHFGIGQDDIILLPTLTFVASVNAVMYENAIPVFFDCDKHLCMDMEQVEQYLESECQKTEQGTIEKKSGKIVKAIMPVHVFGDLCDMEKAMELAHKYQLIVIEDATEALGSKYRTGKYAGKMAGTIGHAGVLSFNGNKIITTGGGGMIISNDRDAIVHMRYLSQQAKDDAFHFIHDEIGFNYRMTSIQAAMGVAQLEQLDSFIAQKRKNHEAYCKKLSNSQIGEMLLFRDIVDTNAWFYSFVLKDEYKKLKEQLMEYLIEKGIQVRPIWKLNHLQKPFQKYRSMPIIRAGQFYDKVINLPCSTNLEEYDVNRVCECVMQFEREYSCGGGKDEENQCNCTMLQGGKIY